MFKGYRTVIFNAIMVIVGITGANVSPEMVDHFAEAFMILWGLGNGLIRAITDSPMFKKE